MATEGEDRASQFFKKLDRTIHGFWSSATAFITSLLDSAGFISVEPEKMVVQLDPLIPLHRPQTHGDVIGPILEGTVG